MTERAPKKENPTAALDGISGRGYAVVESLPSLGKGRSCTGIFTAGAEHRDALEALAAGGRSVRWSGTIHARHRSGEGTLAVVVDRVGEEGDGLLVEFTAPDVPYDVVE